MTYKTVLVTGGTGLLGRNVLQAFQDKGWNAVGTGFSRSGAANIKHLDLSDFDSIAPLLKDVKPDVVVHCAANRHPDSCEQNPEQARIINVEGTKALARATSSRGIFLIYISTDYVFPGRPGEAPYEADGKPEPPNTYGLFKLDGEKATLEATKDDRLGVVLRIPVLYGSAKENKESAVNVLVDAVWKAQEKGAKVQMDDWSIRYPTNTEDVGRVCQDIAANYLEAGRDERSKLPTVLQFSSEDRYTKYKMSQILAEILGLPLDGMVANEQGNDPSVAVQRPYDTHLSTKKLKELGIPIWTQDFKAWWRRELGAIRH